jgi:voltage-gated potassium channel
MPRCLRVFRPGAKRVATTGTAVDALAFNNPDGTVVAITYKRKRGADRARPGRESAAAPPARLFARHHVSHVASLPPRRLPIPFRWLFLFSAPVLLIGVGTVGYRVLEGWSWFDSFYVAVITLTSIGYGQRAPLTIAGRVFTMMLALGGIFTVAFVATKLLSTIITGELRDFWGMRRMGKRIDALEHHVIVCGYGHVGRHVCADLLAAGVPVVVIDRGGSALAAARDTGAFTLLGDAIADATLTRAGIDRARALVAAAGADSDNVLITMTARLLRPGLPIVSRAEEDGTVPKLMRAGATRTVSPDAIAGGRMAQDALALAR